MLKSVLCGSRSPAAGLWNAARLARGFVAMPESALGRASLLGRLAPSLGLFGGVLSRGYGESLAHRKFFFMKERRIKGKV